MTKLKGILLTEGMHGMISQVEGLAKALDLNFTHHKVELKSFWRLLPPKITPLSQIVFEKLNVGDFDVVISCGRKSVVPSIYLKKNSKKEVINIHIQDPKVKLNNFNFVIAPEHDKLIGNNVLQTKGAIHYLTKEEIRNHTNYIKISRKILQSVGSYTYDNLSSNKVLIVKCQPNLFLILENGSSILFKIKFIFFIFFNL